MKDINVIIQQNESTVVAEYTKDTERPKEYQSEDALEKALILQLKSQGYIYATIHDNKGLVDNLRKQLERLNNYTFTDKEWKKLLDEYIDNPNQGIEDKSKKNPRRLYLSIKKR